jgi:aminopeptidase
MSGFDGRLVTLAEIGVTVGVNLQPDQELIVSAPLEAGPLVQHVARCAYERGARLVTCAYDDPALMALRFHHAADHTLDAAP